MTYLEELLTTAADELFKLSVQPVLSRPEEQFGDAATNLAMQLAPELKQPPRQVAEQLQQYLEAHHDGRLVKVEVAGPGFLNFTLSDQALWEMVQTMPTTTFSNKRVLLEYSCPNPFKELHVGHLYNTIIGDVLSNLVNKAGATVYRANFGGDVGLHVARALWGITQQLGGENPEKLANVKPTDQANWLSQAYVAGAKADEEGSPAAKEIKELNQAIYKIHADDDHDSPLAQIYWQCREWSYNYFKDFYRELHVVPFDKFYPESSVTARGLETVKQNTGSVFTESDGAVIFRGEEFGTHTRVFITSAGLPTYETKDLGVILTEYDDFPYDQRVVITGNDQAEYMKVVFAALAELDGDLAAKQTNLTNGTVRFGDGKKMSSRLGNVARAIDVLETVYKAVKADTPALKDDITLGAIKYTFMRQRLGGDIAFDLQESVSLQGNSGPYLQYAHARARSILKKASVTANLTPVFDTDERSLVRKLGEFSGVVEIATNELNPHHICTYLYELAQVFNRFYEHNRVIDDERQDVRLKLVQTYADRLKEGLELLTIPAPDHI